MSVVLFLVAMGLGVLVGVWLTSTVLGLWASSESGRREVALAQAEARVRDAQTTALNQVADVVAGVVYDQTTGAGGSGTWPSGQPGTDIDVQVRS